MIELGGGGPSSAGGSHHGMPMLDIKCQSLRPDAARVVTNPVGVRSGGFDYPMGLFAAITRCLLNSS